MDRVNEFKPCPLCGQTDKLELMPQDRYMRVKGMCGGKHSLVTIECTRCCLELRVHTTRETSNNYHILVGELKKKWARL